MEEDDMLDNADSDILPGWEMEESISHAVLERLALGRVPLNLYVSILALLTEPTT
jgi:hypothetical protein